MSSLQERVRKKKQQQQTDDDQRKQRKDLTKSSMMCARNREERAYLLERRHALMGTLPSLLEKVRLMSSSQRSAGAVGRRTRLLMDRQYSERRTCVIAAAAAAENEDCTLASSSLERECTGWIIREQSKAMTMVSVRMTDIERTCTSAMGGKTCLLSTVQ